MSTPNIVFILSDDHGYGDISLHNGPGVQTPNIDAIARDGLRFDRFYANSCVCSPSRAALLTGRYPDRVGVPGVIRQTLRDSWGYFDPAAVTLPDMLHRAGYRTVHVGKWHLGLEDENHPRERGFDEFRGFIDDMMDDYWTHRRFGSNGMRHNKDTIDPEGHATDLFTEWAVETIGTCASDTAPFFLYLAYNAPHTPIQPPNEWVERVRQREPGLDPKRTRYNALVEHMDAGIGRVLEAIDAHGIRDNTIVVYASDNGGWLPAGACNDPLRGGKCDMYEGGIRVPCAVRWPARVDAGGECRDVGTLMDFFPTLCEAAGVPVTHPIEGRSLVPLLDDPAARLAERDLYWVRREGAQGGRRYLGQDYHAIRRGDIKLLHNHAFAPLELYDLGTDAKEEHDLVDTGHPHLPDLCAALQDHIRAAGSVPWQKPGSQTPPSS